MAELTGDGKLPKQSVSGPDGATPRTSAGVRAVSKDAANWLLWLQNRLYELTGTYKLIEGTDTAADTITITAHGYSANDPVRLLLGVAGTVPAGLSADTVYYVKSPASDTFKLAATSGGAAIDLTGASSGEVVVTKVIDPGLYLPAAGVLGAGKLSAVLAALLARCGQVASGIVNTWSSINVFTAASTFSGDVAITGDTLHTGKITRTGPTARLVSRTILPPDGTVLIDVTADIWEMATPTAQRDVEVDPTIVPHPFESIWVSRPATGAHAINIHQVGEAANIVTLPASKACAAEMIWFIDSAGSARWRLGRYTTDANPGADA